MIVEIRRARGSDCDFFGSRLAFRDESPHPTKRLQDFVLRSCAGIQLRLGIIRFCPLNFYAYTIDPVRNRSRSGDPTDWNDVCEGPKQGAPADRHFAMAVDLDRSQHDWRMCNAGAGQVDKYLRFFHRRRQPP